MKILVNSSIRDLSSKGMSLSAKAGATWPQEGGGMQLAISEEQSENNDSR